MTFHEQVHAAVQAVGLSGRLAQRDHIRIETRGGDHVILWGTVHSRRDLERVEQAVWAVPGVCNVDSNLTVSETGGQAERPGSERK